MKNQQKGFIVPLLLGIIVLLVVGGGAYMYKNKKAEAPAFVDTNIGQSNQVQQEAKTDNSLTDIVNWKTYTNDKYDYQFQYPSFWGIVEDAKSVKVAPKESVGMNAYFGVSIDDRTLDAIQKENDDPSRINDRQKSNIRVGGMPAIKYDLFGNGQGNSSIYFSFKGITYQISTFSPIGNNSVTSINSSILSTFKFIKKTESNILSISIIPSTNQDGWITFQPGAKVVVIGKNLEKVELRDFPTGTGSGEEYPAESVGWMTKVSTIGDMQTWIYKPKPTQGIMSTNFWAVGYTADGAKIKSQDLGNVAGGNI